VVVQKGSKVNEGTITQIFTRFFDSKKLAQILQVFAELAWLKNLAITISFYFLPLGASRKKILQKITCMIFFFHTARFGLKG
jgi:hypothetical protein